MGTGFRVRAAEPSGVARRRVVAAGDGGTGKPRWAARIRPRAPSAAALPPSTATRQMQRRNPSDVMSLALSAGAVPTSHFRRIRRASHCSITPAGTMRHFRILGLIALVFSTWCGPAAHAELRGGGAAHIEWEVKNRFRLFRSDADFQRHVAATRNDGVLAAERLLARETDGRGWARDMVERLCVDRAGKRLEVCDRVGVVLAGTVPANEGCVWSFDDGDGPARQVNAPCNEEVKAHLPYGRSSTVSVDIIL